MIQTARLRLRAPRPDDAEPLAALMTPAVSRWVARWPVPFTPEMAQARIAEALDAMAQGRALTHVIEHQAKPAGWISGGCRPGAQRGHFGYWLGEPHHGQALMQEAAPAFVAALRTRFALHSIEAACQPGNHGSAKVLAICGLHRIGARTEHVPARNRNELVDIWECVWTGPPSNLSP